MQPAILLTSDGRRNEREQADFAIEVTLLQKHIKYDIHLQYYRRFYIFVILISSLILKARITLELKSLVVLKQFWHFSRSQEYILLPFR